jgi:hypothetical protein
MRIGRTLPGRVAGPSLFPLDPRARPDHTTVPNWHPTSDARVLWVRPRLAVERLLALCEGREGSTTRHKSLF